MAFAGVKFAIYAEVKGSNGKSSWNNLVHQTFELNIENVSVQTAAERLLIKEGKEPKIIPFGVKGDKGRVATLTCTFKGRSMNSGTSMGADPYLDVLQKSATGELGYALKVVLVGVGDNPLPELGSNKWRIEQFSWDRQARQLGQWRFNIQLGYLWETPNELQLFDKDASWQFTDNVKFSAHVGIGGGSFSKDEIINNVKINTTVQQLNRATFTTLNKVYNSGDIIHIYCETEPTNACFFGIVNDEPRKNSDFTYTYECIEIAVLLDRVSCAKMGTGLFKPRVKIPNPYKGQKLLLEQIVACIINLYKASMISGYDPKWGIDRTGKWGKLGKIPKDGKVEDLLDIPSQVLSGMTILKALDNVLIEQCGMYTWFDNNTGALEYGFLRTPITIDPLKDVIVMTTESTSYSEDFTPVNVVLYDSVGRYVTYPNDPVLGTTIQYKFDSDMNNIMLNSMAAKIHKDLQVNRNTYKVKFPAGTVKFKDGDVFTGLGDSTISPAMPYKDNVDYDPLTDPSDAVWQIKEMTITNEYTEVLVGPSYFSVFDLYKTKLNKVTNGAPIPTDDHSISTNEVPISTQALGSKEHLTVV